MTAKAQLIDSIGEAMAVQALHGKHSLIMDGSGVVEDILDILRSDSGLTALHEVNSDTIALTWRNLASPKMQADILYFPS